MNSIEQSYPEDAIAIIGMDCRFPGANSTQEFWKKLVAGTECVEVLSDETLRRAGISEETLASPDYVKVAGLIDKVELFDEGFFGYTPTEAMHMDPQQCLFLECCWHALEDAGYNPYTYPGAVAVYGGERLSTYYVNYMACDLAEYGTARFMQSHIGTDRDHLCTRVSYKLNLRGPAFNLQCACSTSLVAVHLGIQALLNGEADMVLAGASAIDIPQEHGHFFQEGMIFSSDGHCRPYDSRAQGIVSGSGVGVVLLKRLDDALRDRDDIHAILLASAINNDGSSKVAYAAPSLEGQSEVIAEALGVSGVEPASIGYIEGHGTGTYLGDPLEVEALTRIYGQDNPRRGYCALGSVKSNVGHLEVAAGVASLIKTVMTLKSGTIAPTCHFEKPNPRIHFEKTPFFVNSKAIPWPEDMHPRRAAVSSFGVGGTNAHAILEEAPQRQDSCQAGTVPNPLLVLSGRSEKAVEELTGRWLDYLASADDRLDCTDLCHTAQEGREHHAVRLAVMGSTRAELLAGLENVMDGRSWTTVTRKADEARPVFLFTGQGAQRTGMGQELCLRSPVFREALSKCASLLDPHLSRPVLDVMWKPANQELLDNTAFTQPALFCLEYALARFWQSMGVQPLALAGHSIGEYTAAVLAGVFSLEDACRLVAARGRLIASLPAGGGMSAVLATEEEVLELLDACGRPALVGLAAVNGSRQTVLTGPVADLQRIQAQADRMELVVKPMTVSHAFHSPLMEPILDEFRRIAETVSFSEPVLPVVSNVTGKTAGRGEISSADYWTRHILSTVRFLDGFHTLETYNPGAFLECGPTGVLTALCRRERAAAQNPDEDSTLWISSMHARRPEYEAVCEALGSLYTFGVKVRWDRFAEGQGWGRLHLPLYPFQGNPHFVDDTFKGLATGKNKGTFASPEAIWKSASEAACVEGDQGRDRPDSASYAGQAEQLQAFCSGCALDALKDLGAFEGDAFRSAGEIADLIGTPQNLRQMLGRVLESLAADGLLEQDENGRFGRPGMSDQAVRGSILGMLAAADR